MLAPWTLVIASWDATPSNVAAPDDHGGGSACGRRAGQVSHQRRIGIIRPAGRAWTFPHGERCPHHTGRSPGTGNLRRTRPRRAAIDPSERSQGRADARVRTLLGGDTGGGTRKVDAVLLDGDHGAARLDSRQPGARKLGSRYEPAPDLVPWVRGTAPGRSARRCDR